MKQDNGVSEMIGCIQVEINYSFMIEIILYIQAWYVVFLFVKSKNNFIKK